MQSIPESHRDLLDAQVATLATVGDDGRPQQSEVWFLAEDGAVKISLCSARQKTKNLLANPAIGVLIIDTAAPHRYLEIRGDAALVADPDYVFADRVGAKYGGADLRKLDKPGEVRYVVTINPTRIRAVDMSKR
ncbi:MAG TPA: PPOX class F420-dependent oxidoreductase [Acidimicrobiales bacterium]|nr:PPOX class F420-dependent oxidoreductase [Acidimicrobiales bacterium]